MASVELWGPVSAWVAAAATFLAAAVALFGFRIWDLWQKPVLDISFARREPWCRPTQLNDGTNAYWVRVKVENKGRGSARGCVGRVIGFKTNGKDRDDRDPMQLRWAGVPDAHGFEPIDLRPEQAEYLNILRRTESSPEASIETFPDYAPGHGTTVELDRVQELLIGIFSDNAASVTVELGVSQDADGKLQVWRVK